jgi:hypothetical protein
MEINNDQIYDKVIRLIDETKEYYLETADGICRNILDNLREGVEELKKHKCPECENGSGSEVNVEEALRKMKDLQYEIIDEYKQIEIKTDREKQKIDKIINNSLDRLMESIMWLNRLVGYLKEREEGPAVRDLLPH